MLRFFLPILCVSHAVELQCNTVKEIYQNGACCGDPDGTFDYDTSGCPAKPTKTSAGTWASIDGTNFVHDAKITEELLRTTTPSITKVNIDPNGVEGAFSESSDRYGAITPTHYYTITARGQKDRGQTYASENAFTPRVSGGDADIVAETEIQCRDRETNEVVWVVSLEAITDTPYMYSQGLSVEDGVVYGTAYTHYQMNSGVYVFALDALTGATKYVMRADRMRVAFDNIKYVPDGYVNPASVPYSRVHDIPEFVLRFGNVSTTPLKVGCSSGTMKQALAKLGFKHVFIQRNDPYDYTCGQVTPAGGCASWTKTLSEYGEMTSGALSYDLIFTATRGVHYTVDADHGVVYDARLDMAVGARSSTGYEVLQASPYDFTKYTLVSQMYEQPELDNVPFRLPLLKVELQGSPPKLDNSAPYVADAMSMNMVAASHSAPKVIGDSLLVITASVHYHYGLTGSIDSDFYWTRFSGDQTSALRINRHTGRVMWLHKNSPDHLLLGQRIPNSTACKDAAGALNTEVWLRRSLSELDALLDWSTTGETVRLFFMWGVAATNHFDEMASRGSGIDAAHTLLAAYGSGLHLSQLPHALNMSNTPSMLSPSGNRFPEALEGAVFIDGPNHGTTLTKVDGSMPLVENTHVQHPMYIDWTIPSDKTWPVEFNNFFFYYKKPIGERITHRQEQDELMYSGASSYGQTLNGYDDKGTGTVFYTTGHNYHIALNDLIRVIEVDSNTIFNPNTYQGQHAEGGFNPIGTWTPNYLLTVSPSTQGPAYMALSLMGIVGPYHTAAMFCGNLQTLYYSKMRYQAATEITNAALAYQSGAISIDQLKASMRQNEHNLLTAVNLLDSRITHLSKRGSVNYGGAAVALDWANGHVRWGSRNVINNVFKHGGAYTLGFSPNQGNNNGVMLINNVHDGHTIVLSTSKTGWVDRFLLEDVDTELSIDGFVYPADTIDNAGRRVKNPIRKLLGLGDQFGGTVFSSWAYDKNAKKLVVAQNNDNGHLFAGWWGRNFALTPQQFGDEMALVQVAPGTFYPKFLINGHRWVLTKGPHAGDVLASTDGLITSTYSRYMAVVDMTDPNSDTMVINEIPIDDASMLPLGSDPAAAGWTGRMITVNGLIFIRHASATATSLATAGIETTTPLDRVGSVSCLSAFNYTTSTRVWSSPFIEMGSTNVMPSIVDGEIFAIAPSYRQAGKYAMGDNPSKVMTRIKW